jgi:hypothetical protein
MHGQTVPEPLKQAPLRTSKSAKAAVKAVATTSSPAEYKSPLKKLKKEMEQHPQKEVTTIDGMYTLYTNTTTTQSSPVCCGPAGLRDFINMNDVTDPDVRATIRIKARLLWMSPDTVKGLHFLRLYLGEAQDPTPLAQQQQVRLAARHYRSNPRGTNGVYIVDPQEYQDAQSRDVFQANQYLITTSLYEVDPKNPRLPSPGDVVAFTPIKMRLYRNCCQVDTRLQSISVVKFVKPLQL